MPSLASVLEPMSVGAVALVGSVAAIAYLAVFFPHYWLGWWGGICGSVPLLRRNRLVREERRLRHPSVRVALVELAADAAPDRVLAELPQDR